MRSSRSTLSKMNRVLGVSTRVDQVTWARRTTPSDGGIGIEKQTNSLRFRTKFEHAILAS